MTKTPFGDGYFVDENPGIVLKDREKVTIFAGRRFVLASNVDVEASQKRFFEPSDVKKWS